jgi:hypothetical protein
VIIINLLNYMKRVHFGASGLRPRRRCGTQRADFGGFRGYELDVKLGGTSSADLLATRSYRDRALRNSRPPPPAWRRSRTRSSQPARRQPASSIDFLSFHCSKRQRTSEGHPFRGTCIPGMVRVLRRDRPAVPRPDRHCHQPRRRHGHQPRQSDRQRNRRLHAGKRTPSHSDARSQRPPAATRHQDQDASPDPYRQATRQPSTVRGRRLARSMSC